MLKYSLAALTLKACSLNAPTKSLYRRLGNSLGGRRRERGEVDFDAYITRGDLLVDLYGKYEDLKPTDTLLELGTGWIHWYAIYLRLAYECKIATLDIWDNRQFRALKACFSRLPARSELLERVLQTNSLDELYDLLGFEHVIVPNGLLDGFSDESLTSVFSMHVLEHVPRKFLPAVMQGMFRAMKPGHHTIHQIGIDDHLAHYDGKESHKKYVSFSNRTWTAFFENEVQYQNRLQPSDWMRLFHEAGFELVYKEDEMTTLDGLSISKDFQHYPREDLACTILTAVFRRP